MFSGLHCVREESLRVHMLSRDRLYLMFCFKIGVSASGFDRKTWPCSWGIDNDLFSISQYPLHVIYVCEYWIEDCLVVCRSGQMSGKVNKLLVNVAHVVFTCRRCRVVSLSSNTYL